MRPSTSTWIGSGSVESDYGLRFIAKVAVYARKKGFHEGCAAYLLAHLLAEGEGTGERDEMNRRLARARPLRRLVWRSRMSSTLEDGLHVLVDREVGHHWA